MAPIVLKVKGNMQSLPFGNLDSSDDLSKTWRVCTKVKDSLENGSRLENLSWRLWFAHNVNKNESNNTKKSTVTPKETVTNSLRNFKVPDNFDFKAKNNEKKSIIIPKMKQESKETDYKRQLCLQQQKQAHDMITHKMKYPPTASIKKTIPEKREEFTLHQYTSDQAGDQVIELDDIFKSLGGNMQAYLNPSEEQQLDNLINEAWPISSSSTSSIHDPYNNINSNATSPMNISFPSSVTNTMYNQEQQHQQYSDYTNNNDVQDSALYVSSEAMPPIPLGTLHNKLLNTLPRETLESAERLLTTTNTTTNSIDENNDMMVEFQLQQQQHNNNNNNHIMYHQSTPNTPFISSSSSFNVSTPTILNSQQQQQQQQLNDSSSSSTSSSSYRFFMPPPQQPVQHQHTTTPYTFSHHHPHPPQHSKSLPPSRAASPPPCDVSNSSSSASSSPISPTVISTTSTPQKRASAPINSSPSEGKAPICSNCSTASTPLWRRSANDELLCNACGLYLKLHNAPRPKYLKPQSSRKDQKGEDENIIQPLCSNCGTSTTPLWRRDLDGSSLCNACGLYLKLHHEKRPLSMKTDNIKKRQRCDNNSTKAQPVTPTSNTATKKKNRVMEEPLTTTVTFDSTYSYMEDVIPNNNQQQQQQQQEYSPFGTFGLTLTNQPI